jgi:hypothetical protein
MKAFVGLRPVVFVPRTLWRTWGTRPVSGRLVETEKETADPSATLRSGRDDKGESLDNE